MIPISAINFVPPAVTRLPHAQSPLGRGGPVCPPSPMGCGDRRERIIRGFSPTMRFAPLTTSYVCCPCTSTRCSVGADPCVCPGRTHRSAPTKHLRPTKQGVNHAKCAFAKEFYPGFFSFMPPRIYSTRRRSLPTKPCRVQQVLRVCIPFRTDRSCRAFCLRSE